MALRGSVAAASTTAVMDEPHTSYGVADEFIPFDRIPDTTKTVTVKDNMDTVLIEGDDYEQTKSGIKVISGGGIDNLGVSISYTPLASNMVQALIESGKEFVLFMEGLNDAQDGKAFNIRVHRVKFSQQRQKLAELRKSLNQTGLSNHQLAQQQERVTQEIRETSAAFQKANTRAKEASKSFRRSGLKNISRDAERASGSLSRLSRRFAGLVAASVGLYSIKRGIESILTTGDKFERLNVQLEAIMGSMAEGERALVWIKDFTQNTPFQLEEVSEAFVRLKAFGLDPMDGSMQAIVDQAAKLGRDTIRLLIAEIGKSAEGAAAKNMILLSGYVSNLKDRWQNFVAEIADSGVLEYTKNLLRSLAQQVKTMQQDGRLSGLAKKISDAFIAMSEAVKAALGEITLDDVVTKASSAFSTLTKGLDKITTAFTLTTNSVTAFFEGFAVGVKGFASAYLYTSGEIIYGWTKMAEVVSSSEFVKPAMETVNYLRSLGKEFATSAAGNVKTANEAALKVWDTVTKKTEDSNKKFQASIKRNVDLSKKSIDELLGNYQKVNETVEEVGETFGENFESAAKGLEKINAAETRTELASLGVVLAESLRAGIITQEEYYQATEASREKLAEFNKEASKTKDADKDVGDSAEKAGEQQTAALTDATSIAGVMAGHYNTLTAELQGMSGAAHDAFVAMNGVGNVNAEQAISGIAELKSQLEETREELNKLKHSYSFDVTGISSWMNETAKNAAYVKSQYLQQKIALEELLESYEQGGTVARSFIRQGDQEYHPCPSYQ